MIWDQLREKPAYTSLYKKKHVELKDIFPNLLVFDNRGKILILELVHYSHTLLSQIQKICNKDIKNDFFRKLGTLVARYHNETRIGALDSNDSKLPRNLPPTLFICYPSFEMFSDVG